MPSRLGWAYTLGSATLFVFVLQVATGMFLAMYYSPSPDHAYDSIQYIMNDVTFGSIIRGLHHWGASAMVVLVALHLLRVFIMGAYKYPREVTWVVGVVLLALVLGFGFTGYLLPWDEKAFWATTVGTNIMGLAPGIGAWILRVARGGSQVGALTLARFFAAHTLILPGVTVGILLVHLYLVIRNGISAPPNAKAERAAMEGSAGGVRGLHWPWIAPSAEARAAAQKEYAELKHKGEPFFPDVLVKDAVVAVGVLAVLIGLILWRGVPTEAAADPTNTLYVPRPEWYFMFLFELLKHVPGEFEGLVAIGLPALGMLALVLWPFIDRSPARHARLRPYSMGLMSLVVVGITWLTYSAVRSTPPSPARGSEDRLTAQQQAGRSLFGRSCSSCHTVNGSATSVGPDLSTVSLAHDAAWVHNYIENPAGVNPSAKMPGFIPPLSHQEAEMITSYLMSLHGAPAPAAPAEVQQDYLVTISRTLVSPDTIIVTAGLPVRLTFMSQDIAYTVRILGFGLEQALPVGQSATFEFTPAAAGEYPIVIDPGQAGSEVGLQLKLIAR
jgi:ubiquinol-cytochrome c reductase cytochrome b subunit